MIRSLRLLAMSLLLAGSLSSFAQTQGILGKGFFDNWSIGIGGGPNIFFGDLKEKQFLPITSDMNEVKFGGTATLTKQLSHVFTLRGQFLYSELSGTKHNYVDGYPCNEYFIGNIMDGSLQTTVNFSNLFARRYNPKMSFFAYGILGVGATGWLTNVRDLNTHEVKRESDPIGNWTWAAMGMIGVGVYKSFHEKVNLGLEFTAHGVNSDKVDVTKMQFRYDAYTMLALTVTYNFNKYNPGKEPDTAIQKIYVPVYIPQPITMPKSDSTPPVVPIETPVTIDTIVTDSVVEPDTEEALGKIQEGAVYRVQIMALRKDKFTAEEVKQRYNIEEEVIKDASDGWFRYAVGSFTNYSDAKALKAKMINKGFKGTFITKYEDGTRVIPKKK